MSAESTDLRARWDELDRSDPAFAHVWERVGAIEELRTRAAELDDPILQQELLVERVLGNVCWTSLGPPNPALLPNINNPDATAQLARRMASPSPIVRASAGHVLWLIARTQHGRAGSVAAAAYLTWAEAALALAVETRSTDWAMQGTAALKRAAQLSVETGAAPTRDAIVALIEEIVARLEHAGLKRYLLECAEALIVIGRRSNTAAAATAAAAALQRSYEPETATPGGWNLRVQALCLERDLRHACGLPARPGADWAGIGRILESEAERSDSAIYAAEYFSRAATCYERHGAPVDRERALKSRQDCGARMADELRLIHVPAPELQRLVEGTVAAIDRVSPVDAVRLAISDSVLDPERLTRWWSATKDSFVFHQIVSTSLLGPEGTSRPGGDHACGVPRDVLLTQVNLWLQMIVPVFEAVRRKDGSEEAVRAAVLASNAFDEDDAEFVKRCLAHWYAQDHLSAAHVLAPLLERVIRRVAQKLGIAIVHQPAEGIIEVCQLVWILERLRDHLPAQLVFELEMVLTDPAGLGLRHAVAHGLRGAFEYGPATSAALLHALLRLGPLTIESSDSDRDASEV